MNRFDHYTLIEVSPSKIADLMVGLLPGQPVAQYPHSVGEAVAHELGHWVGFYDYGMAKILSHAPGTNAASVLASIPVARWAGEFYRQERGWDDPGHAEMAKGEW